VHVPLARKHNVAIFISDNASTDNTKEIVEKWQREYSLIIYYHNKTTIDVDENFERAVKYPDTKYVWLLGDTYQIPSGGIDYLLGIAKAEKNYCAIVFNIVDFIKGSEIGTREYADQNMLLADLGPLMTCLSSLVFSRELIKDADFSRYRDSSFIHSGVIFEFIASRAFTIHWVQSLSVMGLPHPSLKKISWYRKPGVFEVACKRWSNFVFSLPVSYNVETKLNCILDFGKISGIFTYKGLFNLRRLNLLNYKSYRKYSLYFPLTIDYPKVAVFIISITPRLMIKVVGIVAILITEKDKLEKIKRTMRDEA
jgi:glycosyltransferase involved in cell wall biosynthesis